MKNILSIFLLFFVVNTSSATDLLVRIFSTETIRQADLSCVTGQYRITDENGNEIIVLNENDSITLYAKIAGVRVVKHGSELGVFEKITVMGDRLNTMFRITPKDPSIRSRIYYDHLEISVVNNALRFINIVNIENYIAGVVQSEVRGVQVGGIPADLDFFKIQAIISRTYAMRMINKHRSEGFNLCDGVHCQAYFGRNVIPVILEAARATAGMVVVDENSNLILASFHANSGGQTKNSEDAWVTAVPYLRSIADTFSFGMPGSTWQREFSIDEWLNGLQRHYGYDINDPVKRTNALNFVQDERKTHFHENIRLRDIRRDFNLRSTFFSVRQEGNRVILDGRGFGHGVGLSQEGAARKIREGFSVEEVLQFYYQGVRVVRIDDLFEGQEQQF
ncbi:MAG: SpoIID/LytB domain-containing protein [Bacteroidales bacterium]|nr:SpoIID/LytB domain-containing protein [Bacteroidales bacterium]